ncbi:YheC/YheD family protein [Heliobacterium chlorum]|uniref:YheC/YheD family protein n=1 Tax=Heliobacterium chlorum TaxID=2698 RepID=A0ABR7T2D4_HELCL|nr:YheC/YheD family protein [Heliobacterium chlorum]MBC9783821.1 YheC/YheD family protein [Heliobacterium chlorum]
MLGPRVGVIAWGTKSSKAPFGRWSYSIAEVVNALRQRGINAGAVSIQDLSQGQKISFWRQGTDRLWHAEKQPVPDIFYNRILSRRREQSPTVQKTLRSLQEQGKILFNPGYLSKELVYNLLVDSDVCSYLPETLLQPSPGEVVELVAPWKRIYLKPLNSCAGKGIYRLQKVNGRWQVTGVRNKGPVNFSFQDDRTLCLWMEKLFRRKKYLAQRGILLDRYRNRPYDFRVLVQKNETGEWTFVNTGIRLAARGQVVTHRPNGGQIVFPEKMFNRRFGPNEWKPFVKEISQMSVGAAKVLEERYGGTFGILTLDVGWQSKEKKLWILEINSKPGSFDEPHIQRKSYDLLTAYLRHLWARRGMEDENIHSL